MSTFGLLTGYFAAMAVGHYIDGEIGVLWCSVCYLGLAVADGVHMIVRELKKMNERS